MLHAYPSASKKEQLRARLRCLLLLPLYAYSLTHSLSFLLLGQGAGWLSGPDAFTLSALIACLSVFTFKIELMVASHYLAFLRKVDVSLLVPVMLVVPLFTAATNALHYRFDHDDTVLLTAAALSNIPFMCIMIAGCLYGIRDPYWPAAFRKMLAG